MDLPAASLRVCDQQSRLHMLPTSARHFQQAFGSVQQALGLRPSALARSIATTPRLHGSTSAPWFLACWLAGWRAPPCLSPAPCICSSANLPRFLHGSIGTSLCARGERTFGGTVARRVLDLHRSALRSTGYMLATSHCSICTVRYSKHLSVPTCQAEWPVSSHPHPPSRLSPFGPQSANLPDRGRSRGLGRPSCPHEDSEALQPPWQIKACDQFHGRPKRKAGQELATARCETFT